MPELFRDLDPQGKLDRTPFGQARPKARLHESSFVEVVGKES